jgi:hypothetical protein
MLKFRPSGLTDKERHMLIDHLVRDYCGVDVEERIQDGRLTRQEVEEYYDKLLNESLNQSKYMVYDLEGHGVYVIDSWIEPPEYYINNEGIEKVSFNKYVSEYYFEFKTGVIHHDVNQWDFLDCERTEKRLLTEKNVPIRIKSYN